MKQRDALEILKMGHNVYLTGAAGSGKTYLLNEYISFLKENDISVAVTASTGIASTHLGGMTIHSWAGIGINDDLNEWEMDSLLQKSHLAKRFQNTKVLIIDEVSMLHHYRLDLIDKVCRAFRQKDLPFGGMQIILSGDFFQLPPISKNNEGFCFINKANVWNDMDLKICYLDEQYRQDCDTLTNILNNIRQNNAGENVLAPLRLRYKKQIDSHIVPTKLYTHNVDIDIINNQQLDLIEGSPKIFEMQTKGKKNLVESLKKSCLAQEELRLKKGAVVMFLKNNPIKKYVNGTLGNVIDFSASGLPIVKTYDGRTIEAEEESWVIDEEGKIKAELKQIPLRLAWAITIHKSQGMSLDCAEIDLSKSFVEGMGYVALSRVKKIEGLRLMGLNEIALRVNEDILNLDGELMESSRLAEEELNSFSGDEIKRAQKIFLDLVSSTKEEKEDALSTYEKTRLLVEEKLSIKEMAKNRELTETTIISHLEKLLEEENKPNLKYLETGFPSGRLKKIKNAFKKSDDMKLTPVKEILGDDFEFEEIRIARLFL
ncbi:hypothetical protein A3I18_00315 [Candidatus Campbellbacteria bacterium RIFCSPLOWO2_02_FULL_35_11]|uniref:Uncharacterized protein n=2 Tax=Candidatus Campbelliibacteriota TaxID=1752727 RepID=A0A1F5EQ89_9BACT|nr:MAG: hypothetical protein A3E89_02030 [Candidatus Campbellbacteria bacterium RIFCSPHIGHO2_12_FULL_35_10]OGD70709.1 MAG: hypothetical protein A3I18_00315 [Candidatus Campbellbacteria bacterium RIFCSPLOWO2_02_FULL_35_11]